MISRRSASDRVVWQHALESLKDRRLVCFQELEAVTSKMFAQLSLMIHEERTGVVRCSSLNRMSIGISLYTASVTSAAQFVWLAPIQRFSAKCAARERAEEALGVLIDRQTTLLKRSLERGGENSGNYGGSPSFFR